ncbi:MAG: lipopolysaccharide assembly protein LapA domain-containing protein [Pseudomonadota bacterium]
MIKKWLFRFLWVPAFLASGLFLLANSQMVALSFDLTLGAAPGLTTFEAPLWAWLMAMLFVGFGFGALGMWLSARPKRRAARAAQRELKALRKELSTLSMTPTSVPATATSAEAANAPTTALETRKAS